MTAGTSLAANLRAALIVLVAALFAHDNATAAVTAAGPYEIYAIVSETGQGAAIGTAEMATFRAAENVINGTGGIHGRPVHFVIADDQTNPAVAVQLFNSILARGVPVMFGPSFAGPCYAVMPLVTDQIVNYCLSPALHPPAGSYSFSANVSTVDYITTGLRYYHARGIKKLAILDTADASGQDGDAGITEALKLPEFRDMQVVDAEHFSPADLSVDAQLQRIKASGAQGVISWIAGTPFATICRGITNAGLEIPLLTSAGNVNFAQMGQYKTFIPKETYYVPPRFISPSLPAPPNIRKAQDAFYKAMQDAGIRPDTLASVAWNPVFVVVDALRHLPEGANAQQLHDYMEKIDGFPGINGLMSFRSGNQRGERPDSALVARYDLDNLKFVPVSKPGGMPL